VSRDWAGRTHPHRSVDDEPELLGDISGNPALGQLCLRCWCSANVARYGVLGVQEEPVQQLFAHVATLPAAVVKYDVRPGRNRSTVPITGVDPWARLPQALAQWESLILEGTVLTSR
jgi:hypothetical protein